MGKRSNFVRIDKDSYDTPIGGVHSLVPHLPDRFRYWEPCAGKGQLIDAINALHPNAACIMRSDVAPRRDDILQWDALNAAGMSKLPQFDLIITNPPWSRPILHEMIAIFAEIAPTWLLFDADWMHTKQSSPYMDYCQKVVSIGRIKWFPDSPHTGKDNCCWYLFDKHSGHDGNFTIFIPRKDS
jgi:hypothetical protein